MINDIINEQQEKAREELQGWLYNIVEHQIERDDLMRNINTLITSTSQAAYNQGINDMISHIEEQISHEILSGSINSNKGRIEDYDLLIEYGRSIRKVLLTTNDTI